MDAVLLSFRVWGLQLGMEEQSLREVSQVKRQPYGQHSEEKQTVSANIAIKGTRSGLLLTLEPETPFNDLLQALTMRLEEAPAFFRGASLTVDTTRRNLRVTERIQLERLLAEYQMSVAPLEKAAEARRDARTITFPTPETPSRPPIVVPRAVVTRQLDMKADMKAEGNPSSPGEDVYEQRDPRSLDDALFIRRTVRSGQAISHHSHVVILGDVNPGAEIVAGGDIIVWGMLKGMVHAGYPDNDQALVCSLYLSPVQLRIARLLSRPPEGFEVQPYPEVAMIRNNQIIVETWMNGRPPRK